MDIQEKLLESIRIVVNLFWLTGISIFLLAGYLIQRTLQFVDEEDGFLGEQAQQQPQIESGFGFFSLEFTYATMNVAWVWILGLLAVLWTMLLKRRKELGSKMQSSNKTDISVSDLLPLDPFSESAKPRLNSIALPAIAVLLISLLLQIFPTAIHFLSEARFVEGGLILVGVLYSGYTFFGFYSELKSTSS